MNKSDLIAAVAAKTVVARAIVSNFLIDNFDMSIYRFVDIPKLILFPPEEVDVAGHLVDA